MPSLPYSLEALLLGRSRSISPMSGGDAVIPDVVISEMHADQVSVTSHPIDTGADVSDHAIMQASVVTCVFGWSDSSRAVSRFACQRGNELMRMSSSRT